MINLMRMEFRSMFRSKSIYITLAVMFGILLIALGTMKLVSSPKLMDQAREYGMEFDESDKADAAEFLQSTQSDFISDLLFNGGLMTVLMAVISSIAVCDDFSTGFSKNIFSFHIGKTSYIISMLCMLAAVSAFFIAALSGFTFLLFRVMGFENPLGSSWRLLLMFLIGWLGLVSLTAQNLFFCVLTGSPVLSIILSIACGLGAAAGVLQLAVGMTGLHIAEFFPSYNVLMAPYISGSSAAANHSLLAAMLGKNITVSAPLLSVIVSLFWTAVYSLLAAAVLKKKDIC